MRPAIWRLSLLAALAAGPALADEPRVVENDRWCREEGGWHERARHCEVREQTLAAGGVLAVDARPNGGVQVQGWDGSKVRLRVKVVATAESGEEARRMAGEVRVETSGTIQAVGPKSASGQSWYASFRLDVPRSQALRLSADNGGLHLSDVIGDVELSTVNGGLHLDRVGGHIKGQTVNGGIHLELTGSEWEGEGLDLRTTNGGVHLQVPGGYNARLEASTVNGGVHSDVETTRRGRHSGGRIAADLGRGGSLVRLETTNGGLHIAQR